MTTRKILFATLAAALLSAPIATTADAATHHRHARHHAMTRAHHSGHRMAARPMSRDAGSASTDALNEQALARARGTAQ